MELLLLFALIILNGVFAMSELAIVSAKKARLQAQADKGNRRAQIAIDLAKEPNRFLSTVQIGITLIGIIAGAIGGSAIAGDIAEFLRNTSPALEPFAEEIGFGLIVVFISYLSLVIGELVPKRIALHNPEQVAVWVAEPMRRLSQITAPLVWLLSKSTELVGRLLGIQDEDNDFITDFEVIAMMREGISAGEFDISEHEMVKGVLELDDTRIGSIATPRTDIIWIDINDSDMIMRDKLSKRSLTAYPVCDGNIDEVIGLIHSKDVLQQLLQGNEINLKAIVHEAFFVPETAIAANVLQEFKHSTVYIALVIDEFGGTEGIVTLTDIVEEVLGDLDMQDIEPVQRDDGSWLVDGYYPIHDIRDIFPDFDLPEGESADYHTIAGFVLKRMGQIPKTAESFEWNGYRIEIMDMDGRRVDKVLITSVAND
jgi:magnesium and cobalt exporter, CNNM family